MDMAESKKSDKKEEEPKLDPNKQPQEALTVEQKLEILLKRMDEYDERQGDFRKEVQEKWKELAAVVNAHTKWLNDSSPALQKLMDSAGIVVTEGEVIPPGQDQQMPPPGHDGQPPMGGIDPTIKQIIDFGKDMLMPNKPTNAQVYQNQIAPLQMQKLIDGVIAQRELEADLGKEILARIRKRGIEGIGKDIGIDLGKGVLTE